MTSLQLSLDEQHPPKALDDWPGYLFYASALITYYDKPVRVHPNPNGAWAMMKNDATRLARPSGKRMVIAELIAEAHHGRPEGSVLVRLDRDKTNDKATNCLFRVPPSPIPKDGVQRIKRGETTRTYETVLDAAREIRHPSHNVAEVHVTISNATNNERGMGSAYGYIWRSHARVAPPPPPVLPFDTEEWRPVAGVVRLEVSDRGRLRRSDSKSIVHCPHSRPLTCDLDKPFSYRVRLQDHPQSRPMRHVADLVAEAFVPRTAGSLVRVDGNIRNDTASNLIYVPLV